MSLITCVTVSNVYVSKHFKYVLHVLTQTNMNKTVLQLLGIQKKKLHRFARDEFWTIHCRIVMFAPKWSAKIIIYKSIQNLCKLVKCFVK